MLTVYIRKTFGGKEQMNPSAIMKIMNAKNKFAENHPKFTAFLSTVYSRGIDAGTVIEITVTGRARNRLHPISGFRNQIWNCSGVFRIWVSEKDYKNIAAEVVVCKNTCSQVLGTKICRVFIFNESPGGLGFQILFSVFIYFRPVDQMKPVSHIIFLRFLYFR